MVERKVQVNAFKHNKERIMSSVGTAAVLASRS